MMQNLARCVDAIQNNDGNVPPFFGDIVKDYNAMTERINPDKKRLGVPGVGSSGYGRDL